MTEAATAETTAMDAAAAADEVCLVKPKMPGVNDTFACSYCPPIVAANDLSVVLFTAYGTHVISGICFIFAFLLLPQ